VNLTDPSGQNWLTTLVGVLLDVLGLASGNPELIGVTLGNPVTDVAEIGGLMNNLSQQTDRKQGSVSPTPPVFLPPIPAGYTVCPPVIAEVTFVGRHQAHNKGALTNPPRQPKDGEVAIRPRDYGVDYPGTRAGNAAGQETLRNADIRIYPDWSKATDAHNGKLSSPPNFGGPSGPMIPNRPADVISPPSVRNDPNRPTSIDVYRSKKPADLKVPTIFVMKESDKAHCPK
jgi:hypothetical protein